MRIANPESMNSVNIPQQPKKDNTSSTLSALASSFGMGMAGPNAIDAPTGGRMLQAWGNDLSALGQTTGMLANAALDGTMLKMAGEAIRNPGEAAQALGHGILETANLYGAGFGDSEVDLGRGFEYAGTHPFSTWMLLDGLMSGTKAVSRLAEHGTREALNAAMRSPITTLKQAAQRYALRNYNMDEWARAEPPAEPPSYMDAFRVYDDQPDYPWATHPPVDKRVEAMERMSREMGVDIDVPLERRLPQRYDESLMKEPGPYDWETADPGYDPVLERIDDIRMSDPDFADVAPAEPYSQLTTKYRFYKHGLDDLKDQIWSVNNGAYRNPATDYKEINGLSDILRLSWVFANLFAPNKTGGWSPEPYMTDFAKKIWKFFYGNPHPF